MIAPLEVSSLTARSSIDGGEGGAEGGRAVRGSGRVPYAVEVEGASELMTGSERAASSGSASKTLFRSLKSTQKRVPPEFISLPFTRSVHAPEVALLGSGAHSSTRRA